MDKLREGIDLYLMGDIYAAVRTLKEYIDEGGGEAGTAYYHIGIAYSDQQKLPLACENLRRAAELEPDKSMYHYRLGVVYSRLMMLDSAIKELKRSIELNPEHQRSRFILGTVYFQQGDMKSAHKVFTTLIKYSPDFAAAYFNRGITSHQMGDDEACENDLKKALDINPNYDEAKQKIAYIRFDKGDYEEAAKLCMQVYENGARGWVFIQYLVKSLFYSGNREKAREIADEALLLFPHNQELQQFLEKGED